MGTTTVFRKGVQNPEGPVSLTDGSWLFVEMDLGAVSHISGDGMRKQEIARTGLPNGLAVCTDGGIWVAEAKQRMLLRVSMAGEVICVSRGTPNLPFLLPNDLCFGPDGAIYMTDSGMLLEEFRSIPLPGEVYGRPFDGRVFRIDPATGESTPLDRGLLLSNGIAFGPNCDDLYVAETLTGNIYRYWVVDGSVKGGRELFGNVMIRPPSEYGRIAGPDGMAFDARGNLYVAVLTEGNVTVLDPDGHVRQRMPLEGSLPTNLAFDRTHRKRILITEASRNELLFADTEFEGLALYSGE